MLTNRSNKSIVSQSRTSTIEEDDTLDDGSCSYYYEDSTAIDDHTALDDSTATSWNGELSSLVRGLGVEIKPPGSSRRSYLPSIPSPPPSPPPSINFPLTKKTNPYDPGPSANHATNTNGGGPSFEFDVSFRPIDLPIVADNEQSSSSFHNNFNVNGLSSLLKSHDRLFANISTSRLAAYISLVLIVLYFVVTLTHNQRHLSSSFSTPHHHKDELFFFTSAGRSGMNPVGGPLHPQAYPPGGAVVVTLISNSTQNVEDLQVALRSLAFLGGEDKRHPTPVLVFNEGYLSTNQKLALIAAATDRPVAFPIVDFTEFPSGFDHDVDPPFPPIGRHNKWGYYQIIRFWITGLWMHPALDRFETVVKMEPSGCFKRANEHLPHFLLNHFVYHAAYGGYEPEGATYTNDLVAFVENYMERERMKPKSPTSWQFLDITWKSMESVPIFSTNVEVISKSFMLTKEVMKFHRALTEWEPFGMWRHRWSVHAIRFMTMALFTEDELIMKSPLQGYAQGREECRAEEVEAALERYNGGDLKKKKKRGYVRRR